jgi:hypothetical protein
MPGMDSLPVTNKTAGEPESLMNKTLETGAAAVQVHATLTRNRPNTNDTRTSSPYNESART